MITVQARPSTVTGKGVGRWRKYYEADDMREVHFVIRHLVPTAQMRVLDGRNVIVAPCRVDSFRKDWRNA